MKKTTLLCLALIFIANTLLFGQKKEPDVILLFDYNSKQWSYDGKPAIDKGKPFFTLQYKSQPVIKVTNLPREDTKVEIDDQYFDVKQEVDSSSFTIKKDPLTGKETKVPTKKYTVTKTMPMVDSDEVVYSLTISDSKDTTLHTTEAFAKVYGRWKIDLSTGVLFHNLQDESYFFADAGNEQSSISKNDNKGKIKPLFPVVMTHIYWQSKGFVNFGASLGLGLDDDGKAGYYLGPTFIFGDRQRAILSVGAALRPTDVLKGKYEEGQTFPSTDLPETTDLVESTYKSGWFVSITYNLSSKVEKRENP